MEHPGDLRYSVEHEWVRVEGPNAVVGITDYAQDALGDVVFVQLPSVGASIAQNAVIGEIESTKSVSDLYAPLSGRVIEVNALLDERPELINTDPYGDGWICVVEMSRPDELDGLLTAIDYGVLIGSS